MMKNQWIKMACVFLLAGIMTAGMDAQPRRGWGGGYGRHGGYGNFDGGGPGIMAAYNQLDLTDEQEEELTSLRLAHYKEVKSLRSKMIELKAKEQTLLSEDKVDMKALNNVIDEQSDLNSQIRKLRAEHRVQVRNILTDEQRMVLDQRRSFRKHGRGYASGCPRGFQQWGDASGPWGNKPGRQGRPGRW